MDSLVLKIAAIGVAGVAAQWLSWRLRLPAIVLLLLAGVALGPLGGGLIAPETDFGAMFRPLVAIAVAIILFEGGITLKFGEIRHAATGVRRLVTIGAPLGFLLGTLAARFVAGLDWPAATILGGLFVVTGPTVIMPLLRQAKLAPRPAALLRWEAILNDPVGALFAVIAFETALVLQKIPSGLESASLDAQELLIRGGVALAVSLLGGYLFARLLVWIFNRGLTPEYLKSPILLVAVLVGYEASQLVLEESGLLTVTVMGVTMANAKLASLTELKRFKEVITILLVSGVFVLLTATLDAQTIGRLDWSVAAYVAAMLFVVRPATILLATAGAGLTWAERALVAWIAPRGVVAVAVAGLFGGALAAGGSPDGEKMTAIAFALVFATVVLHGFTLAPLARLLGLASARQEGVLFVGAGPFVTAFAECLKKEEYPVMVADSNYASLRSARDAGLPTYYGEILSETADHSIDHNPYGHLFAATANDAYNTLVCTDFAPEIGRSRVFQLAPFRDQSGERMAVSHTLGGKVLGSMELNALELSLRMSQGWRVKTAALTEQYDAEAAMRENRGVLLGVIQADGDLELAEAPKPRKEEDPSAEAKPVRAKAGDRLILFVPPAEPRRL